MRDDRPYVVESPDRIRINDMDTVKFWAQEQGLSLHEKVKNLIDLHYERERNGS